METVEPAEEEEREVVIEFWMNGAFLLAISILGLLGNFVCFLTLRVQATDPRDTFTNLLSWLAIIDFVYLVLTVLTFSVQHLWHEYEREIFPHLAPFLLPFLNIFLTASTYCILAIGMERLLSVRFPRFKNQGAFFGYILPLMVFCIFYNLPKFFELKTQLPEGMVPLHVAPTELRMRPQWVLILASSCIFTGLVPISGLFTLHCLVSKSLRANPNPRERTSGSLLTSLIVVLVAFHLPRISLTVYELISHLSEKSLPVPQQWMTDFSHICLSMSSSLNLPLLLIQDPVFRNLLTSNWLRRRCCHKLQLPSQSSESSSSNDIEDVENELKHKLLNMKCREFSFQHGVSQGSKTVL